VEDATTLSWSSAAVSEWVCCNMLFSHFAKDCCPLSSSAFSFHWDYSRLVGSLETCQISKIQSKIIADLL